MRNNGSLYQFHYNLAKHRTIEICLQILEIKSECMKRKRKGKNIFRCLNFSLSCLLDAIIHHLETTSSMVRNMSVSDYTNQTDNIKFREDF